MTSLLQTQSQMADKQNKKKDKDKRKNTSLRLEPEMLKALKIRAIREDSSVQNIIEDLITTYLKS